MGQIERKLGPKRRKLGGRVGRVAARTDARLRSQTLDDCAG